MQLINQRTITPAGQQSDLGDLPVNAILSPDGKHLLVANSGAGIQSLQLVDTSSGKTVQNIVYPVPESVFVGLAYSPDGKRLYTSGGRSNVIHTFSVATDGLLSATGDWKRATQGLTGYNDGYCNCTFDKYTGSMIVGTLSAIGVPGAERLRLYTRQAARNNHYPNAAGDGDGDPDNRDRQATDDDVRSGSVQFRRLAAPRRSSTSSTSSKRTARSTRSSATCLSATSTPR